MTELVKHELPTRDQIDELQREISLLPQADGLTTEHYFSAAGMYCRRLFRRAGTVIVGKVHKTPHFFMCAAGEIKVWTEHEIRHLRAGDVLVCPPGTKRVTFALTDAVGITVHRTDKTDLAELDAELVEEDPSTTFAPGNLPLVILDALLEDQK